MCQPLVISVTGKKRSYAVAHHGGRIVTYGVLGAVAGALGSGFSMAVPQQHLSVMLGLALFGLALALLVFNRVGSLSGVSRLAVRLMSFAAKYKHRPVAFRVLSGMVNGLLPCGAVYIALAGAAVTFTPWDGALYMVVFGLFTLPAMVAAHFVISKFQFSMSDRSMVITALLVASLLLIFRGANLGIPYLSPSFSDTPVEVVCK
ncbi:MAG: sulfite exporter TauE/SafE family protein [Salibacteraceae bacterium]